MLLNLLNEFAPSLARINLGDYTLEDIIVFLIVIYIIVLIVKKL